MNKSVHFPGVPVSTFTLLKSFVFSLHARYLVLIYTLKEAHSRIFVTGGPVFARQKGYIVVHKKALSLGRLI